MKSSRNWYKMLSIKKVSLSEHWIWNMGRKGCLRRRPCWRQLISMCCLKRLRRRRKFPKKILFKLRYLWHDFIGCFFEDLQCKLETRQLETTNRRKINAISKNPQNLNRRTQSPNPAHKFRPEQNSQRSFHSYLPKKWTCPFERSFTSKRRWCHGIFC